MKHQFPFEFSPSIITLLGEQLIHDKKIALSELVKNAYDADASKVEVEITSNQITISDDGCGMDIDTIKNIWLRPGVSNKKNAAQEGKVSPKYKRAPIGEKGIGRLGSHKLGKVIELFSKEENKKEVHFKIDWGIMENAQSISDLSPIEVVENDTPIVFKEHTGTKIIISSLRDAWEESDMQQLAENLHGLMHPSHIKGNFKVYFYYDGIPHEEILREELDFMKKNTLYYFKVTFNHEQVTDFVYKFTPWNSLDKVNPREVSLNSDEKTSVNLLNTLSKSIQKLIDSKHPIQYKQIGKISFEGYVYDLSTILLNFAFNSDEKRMIKRYMKNYGGIRVYRDGLRVFNYGEKGNDILDLDLKRLNRPVKRISSNQLLGTIDIDRRNSPELIEKTNREGFIHNKTYEYFQGCLENIMDTINIMRIADKEKIKDLYLTNPEEKVSIERKIKDIKDVIKASNLEEGEQDKINEGLDSFAKEFEQIKNIFLQASATGLNLTFIVHELDKVIGYLEDNIKTENLANIKNAFQHLKSTINAYKNTIRLDKKSEIHSVKKIIEQAEFNFSFRFDSHNIQINYDIDPEIYIKGKKNLIIGAVNNILDNSIYWLRKYEIKEKRIFIKSYQDDKFINLVIADNGKGFNIEFDTAIKPFITGRNDESSMGIGLHLVKVIVEAHKAIIEEADQVEEGLPDSFKDGAIIKIKFSNN